MHDESREEKYAKELFTRWRLFNPEEVLNEFFSPLDRQDLKRLAVCSIVSGVRSFDLQEEQNDHTCRLHECLFKFLSHCTPCSLYHTSTTVNGEMSWVIEYDPSRVNSAQAQRFANLCFDYFVEMFQ